MGHWTREDGAIKLPSSEFARVRQEVADAITKRSDAIYEKGQEFWKGLTAAQKSDWMKYRQALQAFEEKSQKRVYGYFGSHTESTLPEGFWDALMRGSWQEGRKPARVQKKDLDYPTNRDLSFSGGAGEGCYDLTFDRATNTVKWDVMEGKHAVEESRASAAGKAFFAALQKVKWTRGTGGVITGNNEYNAEARGEGAGGNYVSDGFGPIGAATAPWNTEPYVMADGTRVTRQDFDKVAKAHNAALKRQWAKETVARTGGQGRVGRGVPTGGQYTGRKRTEYGSSLSQSTARFEDIYKPGSATPWSSF